MQEFFMDYGLWLLITLLVVIGLVFLLSGRKPTGALPGPELTADLVEPDTISTPPAPISAEPVFAEPIAPVAPPPVAPQPEPMPASPAISATDQPDDLLRLKGVGPKLNTLLIELGVTSYAQIAAWTDADIAMIDARLGNFRGRPVRDQWVDQARYLAKGDIAGFEATYGKL